MNKYFRLLFLALVLIVFLPIYKVSAEELAVRLKGRILLQVQENGEAWYVYPDNLRRCYLGTPDDAFRIMRELGLGISNSDFNKYYNKPSKNLLGKILLKVEDLGKAYYVNPVNSKMYYLGRPSDAFGIMRSFGLGITNADLSEIVESDIYSNNKFSYKIVNFDDQGATPSVIEVKKGSRVEIMFKGKTTNLSRGGLYFKASGNMGDIATVKAGESKSVSLVPTLSFSYTPFYPGTEIKLPYSITISVID